MKCPICKDTGQILLLTSYVDCDCKIKNLPIELAVRRDCFQTLNGITFAEISGTIVQSDRIMGGYLILLQTVQQRFRFTVTNAHVLGYRYRFHFVRQGSIDYSLEAERIA